MVKQDEEVSLEYMKIFVREVKRLIAERSYRIDALKGIAIIAVVLYHFGGEYLTYGYLGVDIFLS